MSTDEPTGMAEDEIHAFLGRGGTGVLALAADNEPYAIPVSYGFDSAEETVYFRLGIGGGSEKRRYLEASTRARFVIYRQVDGTWRSVIATGPLEPVDEADLTVEVAKSLRQAELPLIAIFDGDPISVEFEVYRMPIEALSGRKATEPSG